MFIWVAFKENATRAKILWTISKTRSNPGFLLEQKKNDLVQEHLTRTFLHGPMIWKVMQSNAWKDIASWRTKQPSNCTKLQLHALMTINSRKKKCRYCELANKTTQQLHKVSTPCIDDHHFKEEETKSVGELSNTCSQIVRECLYLARIGRPDTLWSANKLARAVTKWTRDCDKRVARFDF